MTGIAGERGQLVPTEWVILTTWLLKFYPTGITLWGSFTWSTNISLGPHSSGSTHKASSLDLLLTNFPLMLFPSPRLSI
jgi:hypothetical protein